MFHVIILKLIMNKLKTLVLVILTASCSKSARFEEVNTISCPQQTVSAVSAPLSFLSINDFIEALKNEREGGSTKSSSSFVSFSETVMLEDDYDDRENAIYSEAYGSLLNQDGEVIVGNYLIKVGKKGIFVGPLSLKEQIDKLVKSEDFSNCYPSVCPIEPDDNRYYAIPDYNDLYIHDSFNLLSKNNDKTLSIITKSGGAWTQTGEKLDVNMEVEYVWPSNQKNKFDCDNRIANDTKIYRQKYPFYSEAGVKTKTMKKRGLIWNKFSADITSAITDLCIEEGGIKALKDNALGWVDINKTYYNGKTYNIATKVVSNISQVPKNNTELVNQCNAAKAWIKTMGKTLEEDIDGIRYIFKSDSPSYALTRIKDNIVSDHEKKLTIIFDLSPSWASFHTDDGILHTLEITEDKARIGCVTFSGCSTYKNETKGSLLNCRRTAL